LIDASPLLIPSTSFSFLKHVFADTVRSIALIIASVIAEFVDGVTSEVADATAALVVSLLILLSLIPLFQGLRVISAELSSIRAEERDEALALSMETQQTHDIIVTENSSEEY
jgi:Co/Zn/Cd efflux system component